MKDLLDFNLKNRINTLYELGLTDPNQPIKTVHKSLKILHEDGINDTSSLLDMQY